jgi:hypothetical protein
MPETTTADGRETGNGLSGYAENEDRPLGGYAALMAVYGTGVAGMALLVRRRGPKPLPPVRFGDILLVGAATHKVARRLTKSSVTSPLRAPFTRYEGRSGPAELHEEVRGAGLQKAVGELVTCPFCISQWCATAFTFGLVLAPRATRLTASMWASLTLADLLQFAYCWAEKKSE